MNALVQAYNSLILKAVADYPQCFKGDSSCTDQLRYQGSPMAYSYSVELNDLRTLILKEFCKICTSDCSKNMCTCNYKIEVQ